MIRLNKPLLALLGALAFANLAAADTPLSLSAQVGQQMFFDQRLSGSGKQSCASCHDPANHYAPANDLSVQLGGPKLKHMGTRAVPTLTYKDFTPAYADLAENPDGISLPGPGGGFAWDGRASTLAEQARIPLLSPIEMANPSWQSVVAKLKTAPYAPLLLQAFGADVFKNPKAAFAKAMEALQAFQLEDPSFHPYSSKYDLYASNKIGGTLTDQEIRGFAAFQDEKRGNCAACHFSGAGIGGGVAQFTDYSFSAVGIPRNNAILRGRPQQFDLGLCGRDDHRHTPDNAQYCGMFKTPTLRNVATRKVFFHNGQIKSLREAIEFYNTRDTSPERWYPTVRGVVQKFDDLPPQYRVNLDKQGPLDGRAAGSSTPMSEQDIDDLIAFLNTLTDDYTPVQAKN